MLLYSDKGQWFLACEGVGFFCCSATAEVTTHVDWAVRVVRVLS